MLDAEIPVMGHVGLTPQSVLAFGGFRVQAKTREAAERLLEWGDRPPGRPAVRHRDRRRARRVGTRVTEALEIPTIGIGAGPGTDGQVLVFHDLLGLAQRQPPKFVRQYAEIGSQITCGDRAHSPRTCAAGPSHEARATPPPTSCANPREGCSGSRHSGRGGVELSSSRKRGRAHANEPCSASAEPGLGRTRGRNAAMRPYETMIVFDTAVERAGHPDRCSTEALETIRSNGGNPGAIDRWGKRPLAYEIKTSAEGYYVLVEFSGESTTVVEPRPHPDPVGRGPALQDPSSHHRAKRQPRHGPGVVRAPSERSRDG